MTERLGEPEEAQDAPPPDRAGSEDSDLKAAARDVDQDRGRLRRVWRRRPILIGLSSLSLLGVLLAGISRLVDWSAAEAVGVAGLVVSILGFAVAIGEIQHAEQLGAARQDAVEKALRRVRRERLRSTISQLPLRASLIQAAFDRVGNLESKVEAFRIHADHWCGLASTTKAQIAKQAGSDHPLIVPLGEAAKLGRETEGVLGEDPSKLSEVAPRFIRATKEVSDELSSFGEGLLSSLDGDIQ